MHEINYKAWRWHDNIRFIVVLIVGRWWALHPKSCAVGSGASSHQHNHELTVRQPVQPREHLPVQARGRGGKQLGLGIQPGMTQDTLRPTVKNPCVIYTKCPVNYIIRPLQKVIFTFLVKKCLDMIRQAGIWNYSQLSSNQYELLCL